jgi:phosphoribosylformimino-5-aminoimidazole carboxamide ribotide isomerase
MHKVDDIMQLKADGIGGAIIGKALYEGTISLEEALQC